MSPTLIGKFQYFLEKKDDGNTDPSIKSWSQPVGSLKDIPTNNLQPKNGISVMSIPLDKGTERIF